MPDLTIAKFDDKNYGCIVWYVGTDELCPEIKSNTITVHVEEVVIKTLHWSRDKINNILKLIFEEYR